MRTMTAITLFLAVLAGWSTFGGMINVQFGQSDAGPPPTQMVGPAVVGDAGDYWNTVFETLPTKSASVSNLLDSSGAPTGVDISVTMFLTFSASSTYGFLNTPYADLMRGVLVSMASGGEETISFSNLPALTDYDLYVYTQGDSGCTGRKLTVTVGTTVYASDPADATASTFIEGQNYLVVPVRSDASGGLDLMWYFTAGQGNINGLQLRDAAPSSTVPTLSECGIGLLVLALGGMACRRVRSMQARQTA